METESLLQGSQTESRSTLARRKTLPGAPRKFAKTVTLSLPKSNFAIVRFTRLYGETLTAVKFMFVMEKFVTKT